MSNDFSDRPSGGGRRRPSNGVSMDGSSGSSNGGVGGARVVDVASKLNPAFLALSRLKSNDTQHTTTHRHTIKQHKAGDQGDTKFGGENSQARNEFKCETYVTVLVCLF